MIIMEICMLEKKILNVILFRSLLISTHTFILFFLLHIYKLTCSNSSFNRSFFLYSTFLICPLGLGVYSSSSDEESGNDDKEKSDQSDWETNSILRVSFLLKLNLNKKCNDILE